MRFATETWLMFVRSARPPLRNPVTIIVGISMPLVYLVLFGPLLRHMTTGDGLSSWQWFVPGLLVQLTLFGTAYAGFTMLPETRSGVMERMRVTPSGRTALLLGRVLKDVVLLLVQAVLMVGAAMILGFRAQAVPVLLGLGLLAVTGVAVGFSSYALALKLKHEFALAPVLGALVVPLMLLSGVLLPMDMAPTWLYNVSRANPLSYVVDAERAIIAGEYTQTALTGALVAVGLLVAGMAWGIHRFRKEQA
ncbi:ABC transporter permease [Microbispora sp. NPDC049125]|uniref:ABC transporter permease n=1 Tax=Microbispora sp. NPDC049125 TaxID=3154929 RepID=UPI0034666E13